MADDEKGREQQDEKDREQQDDLFEDLDKFFAPIRDVDWPESEGPEEAGKTREPDTGAAREHVEVLGEREPEAEPAGAGAGEPAPEPEREGGGSLFPEIAPAEGPGGGEPDEPEEGEEPEGDISLEAVTQAPPEYRDLPAPPEETEEEGAAAPSYEEEPESEEPSEVSLEAAAEHFAASVRDEEPSGSWEDFAPAPAVEGEGGAEEAWEEEPSEPAAVEEDILSDLQSTPPAARTVKVGSGGELTGPSWQDPTAPEIGLEPEGAAGPRDVPAAFLTGVVLAILAVGSLAIADAAFAVVAGVVVLWAQGELYGALHRRHWQPATALGLVSGALALAAGYLRGESAMLAMLAMALLFTVLWYMAVPVAHRKHTAANIGLTTLGIVYVPLLAGYALVTLSLPDGKVLVLAVIALTFIYDTAAFLFGSLWGGSFFQRPMAGTISPKKTWEGAIAAGLLVVGISVAFVSSYVSAFEGEPLKALALALVVVVAATVGDLAESLLKRDLGVKDMGSVLPGHGGVLDRIDSLLFVAPAAFLFFRAVL